LNSIRKYSNALPSSLWPHLSFTTFQRDFTVCVVAVDGSRAPAIEASARGGKRYMNCLGVSKQRQENLSFITTVKSSRTVSIENDSQLCSSATKLPVALEVNTEEA